ncbi:hypothetical protein ACERZ8_19795 [Tateyamaria armeniaca]|uniref:BON domain-containing protein n=1 Tax=Tateyamaria armeniaca TaxID=2518930 RepID=A0ABW8UY83_9RHOB
MRKGWHILEEAGGVTLCRHMPPRFDVAAHTHLPAARPARLAHQIRQDLWRALRDVRGFSPVVRLERDGAGWTVTAGGRAMGQVSAEVEARIEAVLNDVAKRDRWISNAGIMS